VSTPLAGFAAALLVLPAALLTLAAALVTGLDTNAPCGPAGPARAVDGLALDAEQLANAHTIIVTTAREALPAQAAVIATATALQESTLRNLPYGDRDSLGLFQQRDSWGPAAVRLDPVGSTGLFLTALVKVPGWQQLPVTVASDRVQRSAYPWAVAKWETSARTLVTSFWPGHPTTGASTVAAAQQPPACPTAGDDQPRPGQAGGALTAAGYSPPSSAQQAAVTGYAIAQLGKPYQWGATGPDAFDCSGLTMRAWGAAGVALPRTTYQQINAGTSVASLAGVQPGDLLFTPGTRTAANPGHVGMYLGPVNGTPSLIHAPRTGKPVQIQALSAWDGDIVAIRRPAAT
jgi:cell wall-associated NlpC family hydrolase